MANDGAIRERDQGPAEGAGLAQRSDQLGLSRAAERRLDRLGNRPGIAGLLGRTWITGSGTKVPLPP